MKRMALLAMTAVILAGKTLAALPVSTKIDSVKTQQIVQTVCAACHGSDGNSVGSANPSLAGQHSQYLYRQLKAFKAGMRKDPIMLGMVSMLSEDDMRNLAVYYSRQKIKDRDASKKDQIPLGAKIYRVGNPSTQVPACMACHGPAGQGLPDQYPRLGSQHAGYVVKQLNDFRDGINRKNGPMQDIATRMSVDEINAVAEYISGLR